MANNVVKFLITGDASDFSNAAKKAETAAGKLGTTTDEASKKQSKSSLVSTAALAGAATAVVAFGKKSVDAYVAAGRETIKLERLTGGTAEQMSGLRFAAQQSGVQFNTLAGSVQKFSKGLDTKPVQTELRNLGVASKDAQGNTRPYLDVLKDLSDKFEQMPPGLEKNRAAMVLFGKSGADMEPLLNKGGQGIQDLIDKGKSMGDVFGDDTDIRKAIQAQRDMQAAIQGLEFQVGKVAIPVMTDLATIVGTVVGAFTKLPGPVKDVVEVGGALALVGVAITKAWGLISPVVSGVQFAISKIGGASTVAAAETEAAMSEADAAVASLGSTVAAGSTEFSALGLAANGSAASIVASSEEADASIASLGFTAETTAGIITESSAESAAAIATVGEAAQSANVSKLGSALGSLTSGTGGFVAVAGVAVGSLYALDKAAAAVASKFDAAAFSGKALAESVGKGNFDSQTKALKDALGTSTRDLGSIALRTAGQSITGGLSGILGTPDKDITDRVNKAIAAGQDAIGQLPAKLRPAYAKAFEASFQIDGKTPTVIKEAVDKMLDAAATADKGQKKIADAYGQGGAAAKTAGGQIDSNTQKTKDNAIAVQNAAKQWGLYQNQLHQVADPVFGAISAQQGLQQATQAVTDAEKDYGRNSSQFVQAQQGQVSAALNQQSALSALQVAFLKGGTSVSAMKDELAGWVAQGAITQDEANGVIFQMTVLKSAADNVPSNVKTNVSAPGADSTVSVLDRVKTFIGQIPAEHHTNITVEAGQAIGQLGLLGNAIAGLGKTYQNNLSKGIGAAAFTAVATIQHPKTSAAGNFLRAGEMSQVGENKSELWQENGKTYFLPGADGHVVPDAGLKLATPHAASYRPSSTSTPTAITINVYPPVGSDKAAIAKEIVQVLHDGDRAGAPVASMLRGLVNA